MQSDQWMKIRRLNEEIIELIMDNKKCVEMISELVLLIKNINNKNNLIVKLMAAGIVCLREMNILQSYQISNLLKYIV